MARVLVTGGAGFIGSHVVDRLIEKGHEVSVLDNLSTGNKKNLNEGAVFIERDITEDLRDVFYWENFDYVFHFAAQINVRRSLENPDETMRINVDGSKNVLENAVNFGARRFVFASTGGALYSPDLELPANEDSPIKPMSPYGVSKREFEIMLGEEVKRGRIEGVFLRYANVYGPRQNPAGEAGVISIFAERALQGKPLRINGNGKQTRDYVYVDDVVNATLKALELPSGEYNVGTGIETDVNAIAERIRNCFSGETLIDYNKPIERELERSCLDASKLKRAGWMPKQSIDEGIKETVKWFKRREISSFLGI